jgi:flagellar motor switch protein FliN/FliY
MSSNRDYLTQEEIDALLRQTSEDMTAEPEPVHAGADEPNGLSDMEKDAIGEIGNISFGSAATALSTLLGQKVEITTPQVTTIAKSELADEFPKPHVAISVNYIEGFQGINLLVIKTADAQVIADLMLGGDGTNVGGELSEIHLSAVQEAMNQMMGSAATSMSTIFNRFVNISPPGIGIFDVSTNRGTEPLQDYDHYVKISFRLTIGTLIDSTIMQLLPIPFAKEMVAMLIGGGSEVEPEPPAAEQPAPEPVRQPEPAPQAMHGTQAYTAPPPQPGPSVPPAPAARATGYGSHGMPPMHDAGPSNVNRNVNVQPVQFSGFSEPGYAQGEPGNLDLLLDIPLKVTVELGRTQRTIKSILELTQGSIIELDKLAGEPVDILVNNKLIAKGEVVVIDENFGVRVTDIVSQWDRIEKIK